LDRYHITVYGLVQGVGFRYFVYYSARSLSLTGWVKNCYDGSVELEAQGKEENIKEFIERLKEGSSYSEIENVTAEKMSLLEDEHSFSITY
jgi:acylphosphatase